MPEENIVGPTVTWNELDGKNVKSNDGENLGEIKEVSKYHIRVQKGSIKKKSFWLPKNLADTYDGKDLWLISDKEAIHKKYLYGEISPVEEQGGSPLNVEGIGVVDKRMVGIPANPSNKSRYKNIRESEVYTGSRQEKERRDYNRPGGKEPMNPEDISGHEPTAVKRDQGTDIAEKGQTGTDSPEAYKKFKKSGMTDAK